jgi:hypothetical protein
LCWQPKQARTLEGGDELGPAQGEIIYMNLALQRENVQYMKLALYRERMETTRPCIHRNCVNLGPTQREKYMNLALYREIIHQLGPAEGRREYTLLM